MIRVLFICHGNICRSTMAEYVMKYLVKQSGIESDFFIDSADLRSNTTPHNLCHCKTSKHVHSSLSLIAYE